MNIERSAWLAAAAILRAAPVSNFIIGGEITLLPLKDATAIIKMLEDAATDSEEPR